MYAYVQGEITEIWDRLKVLIQKIKSVNISFHSTQFSGLIGKKKERPVMQIKF